MVYAAFTMMSVAFLGMAATLAASESTLQSTNQIVVTARARIVSGARLDLKTGLKDDRSVPARGRERPCPTPAEPQCRMVVIDLP